ncbi:hypothetical protein [Streptomyces sp. NPDC004270]
MGWWVSGALLATYLLVTGTCHQTPLLVHGVEWFAVAGLAVLLNCPEDALSQRHGDRPYPATGYSPPPPLATPPASGALSPWPASAGAGVAIPRRDPRGAVPRPLDRQASHRTYFGFYAL